MKKVLAALLALAVIVSFTVFAFAESKTDIDFSGMTFEELMIVQENLTKALWASDGWQSVTVPVGVYEVGKDIPEGTWSVSYDGTGILGTTVGVYTKKSDDGTLSLLNVVSYSSVSEKGEIINITAQNGNYIEILYGAATFTTPAGLGFSFS